MITQTKHDNDIHPFPNSLPPGGVKIDRAFRLLVEGKNYYDITIEEIAQTAGVNVSLIYKYYGDKRGILHQILSDDMDIFSAGATRALKGVKGSINKLRKLIWFHINHYHEHQTLSRILLLEARSYSSFFKSDAYEKIKQYNRDLRVIIEEGIQEGVLRSDICASIMAKMVVGSIEHVCLPTMISGAELQVDEVADVLCKVILKGIEKRGD